MNIISRISIYIPFVVQQCYLKTLFIGRLNTRINHKTRSLRIVLDIKKIIKAIIIITKKLILLSFIYLKVLVLLTHKLFGRYCKNFEDNTNNEIECSNYQMIVKVKQIIKTINQSIIKKQNLKEFKI
jgi:hypothetical protein